MRKKVVYGLLALLSIGGLAGALSGMAAQASGMRLDWTAPRSIGTAAPAAPAAPLGVAARVQAFYQAFSLTVI